MLFRSVINTHKNEPCLNHRPHNPRQDVWVDYDDKVYCCTVDEGDGVVYVRRDGIACWSGNSRANNGPLVSLTRQPSEGQHGPSGASKGSAIHTLMRETHQNTVETITAAKATVRPVVTPLLIIFEKLGFSKISKVKSLRLWAIRRLTSSNCS